MLNIKFIQILQNGNILINLRLKLMDFKLIISKDYPPILKGEIYCGTI